MQYVRVEFKGGSQIIIDRIRDIPPATRQNIQTLLGCSAVKAAITSDVIVSLKRISVAIEILSHATDRASSISFEWEKRCPSKKHPLGHEIYQRHFVETVHVAPFEYTCTDTEDYDRARKEMQRRHSLETSDGREHRARTRHISNQEPPLWMQAVIEATQIVLTIAGEKHPNRISHNHFPTPYDQILAQH